MGKYAEDAKQLLPLVGGKENIAAVSHCMTRMRFALVDPEKADVKGIEAMKVVKGSFTQSGQFQVIIGGKAGGKEKSKCIAESDHCAGRDFCSPDSRNYYRRFNSWFSKLY